MFCPSDEIGVPSGGGSCKVGVVYMSLHFFSTYLLEPVLVTTNYMFGDEFRVY